MIRTMTTYRLFCVLMSPLLVCIVSAAPLYAAKYAGDPFSLGVGARGLALGGAVVAGPFDGSAAYWNPAGMTYLDRRTLVGMHAETFGSLLNHDFVAYTDSRPRTNSIVQAYGFYLYYLGGGGIKITRLNEFDRPYVLREESHGDFLLTAAMAGKLSDKIGYGLSAKIIYRDIGTESGYGLTMDAGMLYQFRPALRVGLMVTDITSGFIRYSGKTFDSGANVESIYPTVKPGLLLKHSHRDFTGRLVGSGDIKFESLKETSQYWVGSLSMDTHYGFELGWRELVFGRAGFDIGRLTAGGGFSVKNIAVDFAYLHHSDLDATFRLSAEYRW